MSSNELNPSERERSVHEQRRRLVALGAAATLLISSVFAWNVWQSNNAERSGQSITTERQLSREFERHDNIIATVFWVGESASGDNDQIHNISSAWTEDWVTAYGGVDNPDDRCEYRACGFKNKENSFYFALPFGDWRQDGPKSAEELSVVPWFDGKPLSNGESILKNRWIEVTHDGNGVQKTAYAQWEDVGPFGEDDADYVFGESDPTEARAGIDLSPATADYLGFDGRATVSWRFIDEKDVPKGPWTEVITRSGPDF